ncbi:hypothetical protein SAMN05660733_07023 [Lentzea albidocapillata]|uniref:Uncharacterized protein n=1 Tax=Lentzea albidocapillata TaxID=40571 RepID=A0A1W2FLZ5_9PSEU|nr:hypothetical protein SAMN05660733_07023 [Lentzea albidocapillata]
MRTAPRLLGAVFVCRLEFLTLSFEDGFVNVEPHDPAAAV